MNIQIGQDKVAAEAAKCSDRPFDGKHMGLSSKGIATITTKLRSLYNAKSIKKIAHGGCSNLSENFWNMNTKFSESNRLNEDLTDHCEVTNKLSFCRKGDGNAAQTHNQVSSCLGLSIAVTESNIL